MEDAELGWLMAARRGDQAAFGRLMAAYAGPVYNLAYRMLGSAAEAEDAAQETFLRVYTKLHTYQPERKLSSWILSIASHYCIDLLRRRTPAAWRSLDEEPGDADGTGELPSAERSPEEAAIIAETRDELRALVGTLPPSYRAPLVLRYWHDLSYAEIAEVLGISVQAVKSRLHRARLQLIDTTPAPATLPARPPEARLERCTGNSQA